MKFKQYISSLFNSEKYEEYYFKNWQKFLLFNLNYSFSIFLNHSQIFNVQILSAA